MGKRPLENPSTQGKNKKQCVQPLASKGHPADVDGKRKSGIMAGPPRKATIPRPFNLSSSSTWREAQKIKQKEAEEVKRRQLETFKPQINALAKRPIHKPAPGVPLKKQGKQELGSLAEGKENSNAMDSMANSVASTSRMPLGAVTNTVSQFNKSDGAISKALKGPCVSERLSMNTHQAPPSTRSTISAKALGEPRPITARASMGPPRTAPVEGRPKAAPARHSMCCRPVKVEVDHVFIPPAPVVRRRGSHPAGADKPPGSSTGANPLLAPIAAATGVRTRAQAQLVNPLAPQNPSSTLSRRCTAGPAQHTLPAKHHRVVTFEEPSAAQLTNPIEHLGSKGSAKVSGGKAAIKEPKPTASKIPATASSKPLTPERSSSAPVPGTCTRSESSGTGVHISDDDDDDEESAQNYGPDGYCYITKGHTFCDGRYTALHKLGKGKYSTVWLMYDKDGPYTEFSNFVAVKVGRAMASNVLPEDIKRESNLLEYINKTHDTSDLRYLATVIGSFIHEGPHGLHACMVFKVLGSQLLRLVYERHEAFKAGVPLDVAGVINIFRCILRGTAGFHRRNIVHTDLKPENILLAVPDKEVVERMKAFAKEHNLPAPYLEHRPQATVTPHRSAKQPLSAISPGNSAAWRSDSVDPQEFWGKRSPPTVLDEADGRSEEQVTGRCTMVGPKQEGLSDLPSVPSTYVADPTDSDETPTEDSTAEEVQVSQGITSPSSCPLDPGAPLLPSNFVCAQRGAVQGAEDSPMLCTTDGADSPPPPGLALLKTPHKESPRDMDLDEPAKSNGSQEVAQLQTPPPEIRLVNPGTPQYVLAQGKDTEVLIGDFGLAMVLEHSHELAPPGVNIYPQDCVVMNHNHGMVIQTREYRAPEILLGQDFNVKIDIYSIACIMVELITGEYLWDPKSTISSRLCNSETEIDREHFQHMIQVMGMEEFSKLRLRRTFFKSRFFLPNGDPRIPLARQKKPKSRPMTSILAPHVPEPMLTELAFLLTKMLEFHPNDRWSASQCLEFLQRPVFHEGGTLLGTHQCAP